MRNPLFCLRTLAIPLAIFSEAAYAHGDPTHPVLALFIQIVLVGYSIVLAGNLSLKAFGRWSLILLVPISWGVFFVTGALIEKYIASDPDPGFVAFWLYVTVVGVPLIVVVAFRKLRRAQIGKPTKKSN